VNVVLGNKEEEQQLHRLLWSSGLFDEYAREYDQMKKPNSQCENWRSLF